MNLLHELITVLWSAIKWLTISSITVFGSIVTLATVTEYIERAIRNRRLWYL